jgi:hypothetical protein
MKKNKFLFLGMLALALTFTLVLAGCPNPIPEPTETEKAATALAAELGSTASGTTVTLGAGTEGTTTLTAAVTVPAGVTLVVPEGKTLANNSYVLTVNGIVTVAGTLTFGASAKLGGSGTVNVSATGTTVDNNVGADGIWVGAASVSLVYATGAKAFNTSDLQFIGSGAEGIFRLSAGTITLKNETATGRKVSMALNGAATVNATGVTLSSELGATVVPIQATDTVTLASSSALTIDTGTTLLFLDGATFKVDGTVNVSGTLTLGSSTGINAASYLAGKITVKSGGLLLDKKTAGGSLWNTAAATGSIDIEWNGKAGVGSATAEAYDMGPAGAMLTTSASAKVTLKMDGVYEITGGNAELKSAYLVNKLLIGTGVTFTVNNGAGSALYVFKDGWIKGSATDSKLIVNNGNHVIVSSETYAVFDERTQGTSAAPITDTGKTSATELSGITLVSGVYTPSGNTTSTWSTSGNTWGQ